MDRLLEFSVNHWDLLVALIVILAMMFSGPVIRAIRGYKEVDPVAAVDLINHRDAVYIDVREESEYNEGHVLDSLHIPLREVNNKLATLEPYKSRPIIIGCRSGSRSASACSVLRKAEFPEVYNLKGGILAWQNASLPVQKAGKKNKKK